MLISVTGILTLAGSSDRTLLAALVQEPVILGLRPPNGSESRSKPLHNHSVHIDS